MTNLDDNLRWHFILKRPAIVALVVASLAALILCFVSNRYRSEAHILPVETRPSGALGQLGAAAAVFGLNLPTEGGSDGQFMEVLNSRWIKEKLASTMFDFKFRRGVFGRQQEWHQTLGEFLGAPNMDRTVLKIGRLFSSNRDTKSGLITIAVETRSAELSQAIASRAVTLLESYIHERSRTRGGDKAAFTEARLQEAEKDLTATEANLRQFLEKNRNYSTSMDPSVRLQGTRMEMEMKLKQQIVATLSLNRENALLEEKNDLPILNVLDKANYPIEKSGPARSVFITLAFLAGGFGTLLWHNRAWIMARIRASSSLALQP